MNRVIYIITLIVILFSAGKIFSQSIKGKIIDEANSSPLVGATIKIEGTKIGAITDIDGTYTIENVSPGNYNLIISYIGYQDKVIKDVIVKNNQFTMLNVTLISGTLTTQEIIVEASQSLSNEKALLTEMKNSNRETDGISEQQIKRAPDAMASDVLKRVTGLSIVKDKFVFIRGTSERYNITTLNGALIPSTEPDKKSFSFDIFPSNLLENIIISKTFTPDQQGNFSGGLVQITTKEFPDAFTFTYNMTGSLSGNTTGKDFYQYSAGESKFLFFNTGKDDGGRELPGIIPNIPVKNSNFTPEQLSEFGKAFNNNWAQTTRTAPINGGFQASLGNVFKIGKMPVGVLGAFSYKTEYDNNDEERNLYNTDYTQLSGYKGRSSEYNLLWGGLLNLNAKINDYNKISFKSTFTQTASDETKYYEGFFTPEQNDRKLYQTRFSERSLTSLQLNGNHYMFNILNFNWIASYSESSRNEPDVKTMMYQRETGTNDPYYAALNYNVGNDYSGGRFFSNLKDINRGFQADFEVPIKISLPFTESPLSTRIKIGTFLNGTNRNFDARNFGPALFLNAPFSIMYDPIETIFRPENFEPGKLFYDELTKESDKYTATDNLYAGYMMADIPLNKFRFIIGGRYEYAEQKVNTLGTIGEPINNKLENKDILPSVNFIYKVNDNANIRAAYSQTVSRPELREIAPFSYVDFVSGILVFGNATDLHRSLVRNYDLRFELFPTGGELVSISLFYKKFDAPIEDVFLSTSTNKIQSFKNAENGAKNYGLELEIRKNLGFISSVLSELSFNGNITLVSSSVNLEGLGTVATKKDRRMQGQSPYMVNIGLFYDNFAYGINANLVYNRFGDRISEVGLNGYEDVFEKGVDRLDFSVAKNLFKKFEIKFSAKDILNQDKTFTQNVNGEEKIIRKLKTGQNFSLTISYKY